jgi:hypothetical protein
MFAPNNTRTSRDIEGSDALAGIDASEYAETSVGEPGAGFCFTRQRKETPQTTLPGSRLLLTGAHAKLHDKPFIRIPSAASTDACVVFSESTSMGLKTAVGSAQTRPETEDCTVKAGEPAPLVGPGAVRWGAKEDIDARGADMPGRAGEE